MLAMGSGIQAINKTNKLLSAMTACSPKKKKKKKELVPVMTACRNTFHNGAMTYMLHIHESTIHKILVACVVLTEAMLHTLISNLMNAIWLC